MEEEALLTHWVAGPDAPLPVLPYVMGSPKSQQQFSEGRVAVVAAGLSQPERRPAPGAVTVTVATAPA